MPNYKKIYAIKQKNKEKILKYCENCTDNSGIYFLTRQEDGIKYCYVGQSKHILSRLAEHLSGYQHIDLSIKKHGFFSADNLTGYIITFLEYPVEDLDEKEQFFIKKYIENGYQLLNHTIGGQGNGKKSLGDAKSPKNYHEGLSQGYKNAQKEIKHLFDLHLTADYKKNPPSKNAEKAMEKFKKFLGE